MIELPRGEYYIGDLCYVLEDSWDEVCKKIINGSRVREGLIELDDGRSFALFLTAFGDGEYEDQWGNKYGVDAGLIGAIQTKFMDIPVTPQVSEFGGLFLFDEDFTCDSAGGLMNFGHVEIDTTV